MSDLREYFPQAGVMRTDAAVMLFNSVGSNIQQDTGRVAQELADRYQRMVIAGNRPGKIFGHPSAYDLATDGVAAMADTATKAEELRRDWGVEYLIAAGQSAGGRAALEFAAAKNLVKDLHVLFAYATEPPGWYDTDSRQGLKDFTAYQKRQKSLLDADDKLAPSEKSFIKPYADPKDMPLTAQILRGISIGIQFNRDRRVHGPHWAQAKVMDDIRLITANGIQVHVDLAEESMVDPTDQPVDTYDDCQISADGLSTIMRLRHTLHSSYDSRDFFGSRLAATTKAATGLDLLSA